MGECLWRLHTAFHLPGSGRTPPPHPLPLPEHSVQQHKDKQCTRTSDHEPRPQKREQSQSWLCSIVAVRYLVTVTRKVTDTEPALSELLHSPLYLALNLQEAICLRLHIPVPTGEPGAAGHPAGQKYSNDPF